MSKSTYICVDFDGTCTTHDFPSIGKDIGAVPVLKRLTDEGHKLILFTMRSDMIDKKTGEQKFTLSPAVQWFKDNGIPLYGIQKNPTQWSWTESPKAYGQLYIDDAALGCPLLFDANISDRPYVDWKSVEEILEIQGLLNQNNK